MNKKSFSPPSKISQIPAALTQKVPLSPTGSQLPPTEPQAPSQPHIYFGLPCYGGQMFEACFMSLLRFAVMAPKLGVNWTVDTMVNESLIPRGRNNLVSKFLHNKAATHLMFIDADIRWKPEYLPEMLRRDKDVLCGLYPMKSMPPKFVINTVPNASREGPLEEVSTAGTGFMMVKRHVIEKMIVKYAHLKYNDNVGIGKEYEPYMYGLFDTMIDEHKNYLSEDWTFCKLWRDMGGKVWVHKEIILDHQGTYSFLGTDAIKHHQEMAEKALKNQQKEGNVVSNVVPQSNQAK